MTSNYSLLNYTTKLLYYYPLYNYTHKAFCYVLLGYCKENKVEQINQLINEIYNKTNALINRIKER